ncbi:hypothetical protein [Amycolatopsis sp. NPDC004079]|uniref:hypothetical protein n=1 Tax=Amycolatopsis sp. NPDC004079 TaxID=3154549 RepID=UPI0033B26B82
MRQWPWVLIAVSVLIIVGSSRPLLGPADWAGLGQWVGGLGAGAAVIAAMWLAGAESRHERAREAERLRVQAYYVKADWKSDEESRGFHPIKVENSGIDPMLNVRVVAVHTNEGPSRPPLEVVAKSDCPVLLPHEIWTVDWQTGKDLSDVLVRLYVAPMNRIEITYEDLAGGR